MPEIKKVEIETSETPAQTPPSDRVIELAERVGAMSAREQARDAAEMEIRSELAQTRGLVESLSENVSALSRQTQSAGERAEAAAVVAVATAEAMEEKKEEKIEVEADGEVVSITPKVETRVEVTAKPLKGRSTMQKIFFGR